MSKKVDNNEIGSVSLKYWALLVLVYLLVPVLLLVCGGDLVWWQGWIYSILIVASGISSRLLAEKKHPGLMAERSKLIKAQDMKSWDKFLSPLMAISLTFPLAIVAGLDHNFGWSPKFPIWLNIVGLILVAIGYSFAVWALAENRFFSSVVRIQTNRQHMVCHSGPYKIIRHPGYAGNVWALPGVVLGLSSIWTIIPAIIAFIISVARTILEDRTLQEELPGYKDYASKVKYRLFPFIY